MEYNSVSLSLLRSTMLLTIFLVSALSQWLKTSTITLLYLGSILLPTPIHSTMTWDILTYGWEYAPVPTLYLIKSILCATLHVLPEPIFNQLIQSACLAFIPAPHAQIPQPVSLVAPIVCLMLQVTAIAKTTTTSTITFASPVTTAVSHALTRASTLTACLVTQICIER